MERPRQFGDEEDRALLERAVVAPPLPAELLRLRTRRAVEERLRAPRRWRLAVGCLLLVAATAYGLAARPPSPPAPSPPAPPAGPTPVLASTAGEPGRPTQPHRRRGPARSRRVARSVAPSGGLPPWPLRDEEPVVEEGPPAPPPRLLIRREGQEEVGLVLAGDRVVGNVRGSPVDLTVAPGQIFGRLGHRNVSLWVRGYRAEGEIGGVPVRMELVETRLGHQLREGFSVRSTLPLPATRVEATSSSLSWMPGCQATQVAAGTYEGRCTPGGRAQVVIPAGWQRLPPLTRLTLLSFFLTERDPAMARLFGE